MGNAIAGFIGSVFWLLVFTTLGLVIYVATQYNRVQAMLQSVLASRSNVSASMMKRLDLVTKLMEVVKGYTDHAMLTTTVMSPVAAATLSSNVSYISKIATQLPDLRTSEAYQHLMHQLGLVENDLQNKREIYNGQVKDYNTKICQFPLNLFAANLGFKTAAFVSPEDSDSIEKMQAFTSNDGEAVRQMLSLLVAKVVSNSKQLSESVATTSKAVIRDRMPLGNPASAEPVPVTAGDHQERVVAEQSHPETPSLSEEPSPASGPQA